MRDENDRDKSGVRVFLEQIEELRKLLGPEPAHVHTAKPKRHMPKEVRRKIGRSVRARKAALKKLREEQK